MPETKLTTSVFINRTGLKIKNYLNLVLQPYDLTAEQLGLIRLIDYRKKIKQGEIVDSICKEKTNVARIAERLEKKGLIVRDRDDTDKRSNILSLTTKGKETLNKLLPIVDEFDKKMLEGLSEEDLDITIKTLNHIYNNIDNAL